jgi:hypothetical protein
MAGIKINLRGLRKEIEEKGFRQFKAQVAPRVEKKIKQETLRMLSAFDDHEVTKEIEAGPGARNSSGTLGGYGNLFTFIGFDQGGDPITPLRSLLARSIKITSMRKQRGRLGLIIKFTMPSEEQIAAVTPSPWSTESWVAAVEKGMSGLGRYLYSKQAGRFSSSRSGQGIEASVDVRGAGSSSPVQYTSKILSDMLLGIEKSLKSL